MEVSYYHYGPMVKIIPPQRIKIIPAFALTSQKRVQQLIIVNHFLWEKKISVSVRKSESEKHRH